MPIQPRVRWGVAMVCLLMWAWGKAAHADILLGYGSHFDAPYAVFEDEELVDGWIVMTAKALSDHLQTPVSPVAIPHKRSSAMINEGHVDLYCFTNPAWAEDMEAVVWSEKLFNVSNLVIAKARVAKAIRSPYDLRGFFIGTIMGYTYPPLAPFMDHGQIKRVDTKSFEQNLKMLRNGRVEAAIVPDTLSENLLSRLGMKNDFTVAPYVVSKRALHCAISTSNKVDHERLTQAIDDLKRSGVFKWPEPAKLD